MKNKKSLVAGALALVLTAATMTAPFVGEKASTDEVREPLTVTYELTKENEYVTAMEFNVPEELSADIAELYVNGTFVDKTILPVKNNFRSNPLVFTDSERLEIKFYKLGEHIGTAKLDKGVIE